MMENKIKSINTQHIIDEMMGDFFFHQDPHLLKQEYRAFFDPSEVNQNMLKKYMVLFSNVRYAWQKTLKYKNYFENFYPPADKINEIEALNHHIHAYLEDMITLKNKIEVLFGKMKNDIKKVAVNKTDIDVFSTPSLKKELISVLFTANFLMSFFIFPKRTSILFFRVIISSRYAWM